MTPVNAAVRFEIRLAEEQPIPGLTVARVADSGALIYLHPEIVVNNDDIVRSSVVENSAGEFGVSVELSPSGTERIRQATASHVGQPVAVMVDGKVVTAPVLRSPIGSSALISGSYTRAEADAIAEGIGMR
jgi:preprotein translocase subunit SecD